MLRIKSKPCMLPGLVPQYRTITGIPKQWTSEASFDISAVLPAPDSAITAIEMPPNCDDFTSVIKSIPDATSVDCIRYPSIGLNVYPNLPMASVNKSSLPMKLEVFDAAHSQWCNISSSSLPAIPIPLPCSFQAL